MIQICFVANMIDIGAALMYSKERNTKWIN
jgi:hypothetical protein